MGIWHVVSFTLSQMPVAIVRLKTKKLIKPNKYQITLRVDFRGLAILLCI